MNHGPLEKNIRNMGVLIAIVISIGGLVEIVPLMFQAETTQPVEGVTPYPALQLAGRDIYVREGCYVCHSQQIRPFRSETERYGHYAVAGEFVYDRPFQFGSKRTGPDLSRIGGRYTDEWHRLHLLKPQDLVPESNMPGYRWLDERQLDGDSVALRMRRLAALGTPYSQQQLDGAADAVQGKTEMEALIAYLQGLGLAFPRGRY